MNLHQVVAGAIAAVNPHQPAIIQLSTGPGPTAPDGGRVPTYADPIQITAQVQSLTTQDLRHLEGLNIQGSQRTIYLNGNINAISRVNMLGGDLITIQDGSIWLTTAVIEAWPDWCKVACTRQNGS